MGMIIAVAGLTGSGKNTLGSLLAEQLRYRLVCPTFKDLAKKEGITLLEFQKRAAEDPDIDKKFDAVLKEEAGKGNCVVTTWLGPWMVNPNIRVWVYAPDDVRAERLAKRDGTSIKDAKAHMAARDADNRARYMKLYNVDIYDFSQFDVCVNSGLHTPEELVEIVMKVIELKKRR
jgi:cytidylate kinase